MSRDAQARFPTETLRAYLHAEGITYNGLAELIGCSREVLVQAMHGNERFTTFQAQRICDALCIAPSSIWADWTDLLGLRVYEPMPWAVHAACRGEDNAQFFGYDYERPEMRQVRVADVRRRFCGRCPVAVECRDYARRNKEYGIWGGESEYDRADLGITPSLPYTPALERRARAARGTY